MQKEVGFIATALVIVVRPHLKSNMTCNYVQLCQSKFSNDRYEMLKNKSVFN